MFARKGPAFLLAATFGMAVSVFAGKSLAAYATGEMAPVGAPRLAQAATFDAPAPFIRTAAADIAGQWPVGRRDPDGFVSAAE